jgi:hypothetical protein
MSSAVLHARAALAQRDENQAASCAAELARLGFSVVKVSGRGVSFSGAQELFESVFETEVRVSGTSCQFTGEPVIPRILSGKVESVYFPSPPTFLESSEFEKGP